jgi:Cof subfamily protein (haloacid dehalogenase superfamily)
MASVLGPKFVELFGKIENIPGVFQQGLTVYGPNNTIIYERFLDNSVISKVIQFCEDADVAVIAYAGDDIYTQKQSYYSSIITEFQEPLATVFQDGLNKLHTRGIKVNKLVIINDEKKLIQIRPKLAAYLGNDASLTKAIPVMLEVLPSGASKGYGVNELLKHMKIPSEQVLAFGDGENDIEMLSLVGEGIAVNNAKEELKKVAKFITTSNDDYGVATILEMLPSLKYPSNHFRN